MCKTQSWKNLETRIREETITILATRSDGRIISVSNSIRNPHDVKDLIDFLESIRNTKFQPTNIGQTAIENFIIPLKDN